MNDFVEAYKYIHHYKLTNIVEHYIDIKNGNNIFHKIIFTEDLDTIKLYLNNTHLTYLLFKFNFKKYLPVDLTTNHDIYKIISSTMFITTIKDVKNLKYSITKTYNTKNLVLDDLEKDIVHLKDDLNKLQKHVINSNNYYLIISDIIMCLIAVICVIFYYEFCLNNCENFNKLKHFFENYKLLTNYF